MGARNCKDGATRNQDRSNPDSMDFTQTDIQCKSGDVTQIEAQPKHERGERVPFFSCIASLDFPTGIEI